MDALRDLNGVGLRLADHRQADAGLALRLDPCARGVGGQKHRADILQPHAVFQRQRSDLFGGHHFGGGAHDDVLIGGVQRACGGIDRNQGQGFADIGQGHAARGQGGGVDVDGDNLRRIALHLNIGHPRNRAQTVHHQRIDQIGQRPQRHAVGGHRQAHDRLGIAVGLDHHWRARIIGQIAHRARQRIAGIAGRDIDIDIGRKLDRGAAGSIARAGRHPRHARNPRRSTFDHRCDLGIHRLRRGAGVIGGNRQHGAADIGQFLHLRAHQRRSPRHQNDCVQHKGQHRTAHE